MRFVSLILRPLALLLSLLFGRAGAQLAEPLTLASDPMTIASVALKDNRGTLVVGTLHGGQAGYGVAYNPAPSTAPQPLPLPTASAEQPMFEIGSVSKVFTGLLLAQAVERGDLRLEDTVGKVLADKVEPMPPAVAALTLRQLVTHTACMPEMADGAKAGTPAVAAQLRDTDTQEFWAMLRRIQLKTPAGSCEGAYSNVDLALLGQLLAVRYQTSWGELVRTRITGPLGMNDTVIALGDKAPRMVQGFDGRRPQRLIDVQAYAPAIALRSTAADMLTFSRAILAGAKGPLGPAAARMLTPLARYEGAEIAYAVMVRGSEGGRRTYFHEGRTEGFRSYWLLAPDTGEAMIVLSGNTRAIFVDVVMAINKSRYPVATEKVAIDSNRLDDYKGEYRISEKETLSFSTLFGKLLVRENGKGFQVLVPTGPDRFVLRKAGAELSFQRDAGNAVVSVTLAQGGKELVGRRVNP